MSNSWIDKRQVGRRKVLGALGASAVLSPFVPLLNASGAEGVPKRIVLWYTPHGTIFDRWKNFGPIAASLTKHRAKITMMQNVTLQGSKSGAAHTFGFPLLWTASGLLRESTFQRLDRDGKLLFTYGWNSNPSVDQVIAEKVGGTTPFRSIELSVGTATHRVFPGSRMIYKAPREPLNPESDPRRAAASLFSSGNAGKVDLSAINAINAERGSVLDLVKQDLTSFKAKVAVADRRKIEAHEAAVRSIEQRLQAVRPVDCKTPSVTAKSHTQDAALPDVWDSQMDLMVAALSCRLTNVASMQFRYGENDGLHYEWLGVNYQHHLGSHAGDGESATWAKMEKIYTWYHQKFARFLDALDAVPEGNGTLLDNTLVVWGSECGKGNNHSYERVPFIVAGGKNLGIKTGQVIDTKLNHPRLLVSMCHAMGLTDVQKFGKNDSGNGPFAGLMG